VGDTVKWRKCLAGTPPPDWTLNYYFAPIAGGQVVTLTADASADETAFEITLDGAAFVVGQFQWQARVTDGVDKSTVATGIVTVTPDLSASPTDDTRSYARKTLELIEQAITGRLPSGIESYTVEGMDITKIGLDKLETLRSKYAAMVRSEDDAAGIAAGRRSRKKLFTSFNK
jgi:hypothetical protein